MSNQHNPHEVDTHHRLSGSPGVRVREMSNGGITQHSRASNLPNIGAVRSIPIDVLMQVRDLLTDTPDMRPAPDALAQLRKLLEEWL